MSEVLHEQATGDPRDWQRPEALAEALGVSVRTVRAMAQRGQVERQRVPGGRVYYRMQAPTGSTGDQTQPEQHAPEVLALVERFEAKLSELQRDHAATVAELHERAAAAELGSERQRSAAALAEAARDRALADAEAAQEAAQRAQEATAAAHAIAATLRQRARAAERLADLPWWRRRERAQLRAVLEVDETEALLAT